MNRYAKVFMTVSVLLLVAVAAQAAGTGSSLRQSSSMDKSRASSLYEQGVKAHDDNDFRRALSLFEDALREDRTNPEILNMLAHTQLKLGMVEESIDNYKRALKFKPEFPEAREYLGEAYIQGALNEVKTLKGYGSRGEEELEDLIKEFKEAAAGL